MIHLIDNYYALDNNMGFTLAQDKGRTDKDGNKLYDTIGYCGSLRETLELLQRKSHGELVHDGCIELSQALTMLKEQTDRILKAAEGIEL